MHAKTALAVAGSVLAVPSAALAANHAPDSDALHPSGKLTHDEGLKDGLVRTNVRLSRRLDRKPRVRRLQTLSVSVLRERNRRLRTRVRASSPPLRRISRRSPPASRAATRRPIPATGFYGKYQFTQETWQAVGGTATPPPRPRPSRTAAPRRCTPQAGPSQWPVCGR